MRKWFVCKGVSDNLSEIDRHEWIVAKELEFSCSESGCPEAGIAAVGDVALSVSSFVCRSPSFRFVIDIHFICSSRFTMIMMESGSDVVMS
jgi:hypothetical protein